MVVFLRGIGAGRSGQRSARAKAMERTVLTRRQYKKQTIQKIDF
jgi:hypothetical protein